MSQKTGPIIIVALLIIIVVLLWSIRDSQKSFLHKIINFNNSSASESRYSVSAKDKSQDKASTSGKESKESDSQKLVTETPEINQSKESSNSTSNNSTSMRTIVRDTDRITGEPIPSNWPSFAPPIGGSNVTSILAKEGQAYMLSADVIKNPNAVTQWYMEKLQQSGFTINSRGSSGLDASNDEFSVKLEFDIGNQSNSACTYILNIYPSMDLKIPQGFIKNKKEKNL